mgnify:FL=1|jgi:Fic family protein|nr:MAG TPA: Fic family protein [Caudoviricetes sp.]
MYESLYKLFYIDKDLYEQVYNERIKSKNTFFLDFEIKGNKLFYLEDPELLKKIISIEVMDKKIQELVQFLPKLSINQFSRRCLIDEIIMSNKIERVYSTRREIDDIISEINTNSNKRFKGLVNKYILLFDKENIKIEEPKDIREIYNELALPEIIEDDPENAPDGVLFRKESVSVQSETGKIIHNGLAPESKIIEALQKAINLLQNDDILPLIRIGIFHYLFGYIHPFYDGNGRTSRFISSYLLTKCLQPIIGFRISYTIKENLKSYYEAFKICNDPRNKGDITPFLFMFVDIVEESMTQLYNALNNRKNLLIYYSDAIPYFYKGLDKKYDNIYYQLVQATLFSENGITIKELMVTNELSKSTIISRLNEIKKSEILIEKKIGKSNYYNLDLEKVDQIIESNK